MRRIVCIRIDDEIYEIARKLDINISYLTELAILRVLKQMGYDITPFLARVVRNRKKSLIGGIV